MFNTRLEGLLLTACLLAAYLGAAQAVQRQGPDLHMQEPKMTAVEAQPLTRYEAAVAMHRFITQLEKGLSEGMERPIFTGSAGALKTSSRHPVWARQAVAALQQRGLIDSGKSFNGKQPMPRHEFASLLNRYIQTLDKAILRSGMKPFQAMKAGVQPKIALPKNHPAYAALANLAKGGWIPATSPIYTAPQSSLMVKDATESLALVTSKFVERYTNREPH
jgi:hypothetical protein